MRITMMMFVAWAVLTVTGCWTVEPQETDLTQEEVSALEAKLGDLMAADREELKKEVEAMLDSYAERVLVTDKDADGTPEVAVTLEPPLLEAGKKGGKTILEDFLGSPGSVPFAGIINGFYAIATVLLRRGRFRKE